MVTFRYLGEKLNIEGTEKTNTKGSPKKASKRRKKQILTPTALPR
jgi:hypothetical protein